jgi:hypothetical protein
LAVAIAGAMGRGVPGVFGSPPGAVEAVPAAHPGADGDHFDAQFQEALGIKDTGADVLTPLAVIWSKPDKNAQPTQAEIDDVVAALLKGPHPTALLEKLLPMIQVGATFDYSTGTKWKWGNMDQWDALGRELGKQARALADSDPKRASELYRAAMMLVLVCDYYIGWYNLASIDNEPEVVKKLLNLPEGQFEKLQNLMEARASSKSHGDLMKAMMAIDTVTAAQAVNQADVQGALKALDLTLRDMPRVGDQYRVVHYTWSLLNLVKSRHNLEGQAAVEKQLLSWKAEFPDPDVQRWIEQALSREGPPPHQLVLHLSRGQVQPAGK